MSVAHMCPLPGAHMSSTGGHMGDHTKALGFYVWSPFSLPPLSLSKVSTHLSLLPLVSQLEFLKKKKTKAQKETTAPAMVATLATASITVVACKILSPAL